MSCYNPRLATPYPFGHPKFGQYRLLPLTKSKIIQDAIDPLTGQYLETIRVPCGECVGCRLDYSREWASRIMMECLQHDGKGLFVTLTYDDDNLPIMLDDGSKTVAHGLSFSSDYSCKGATLYKKDVQDWLKRLRRSVNYHYGVDGVRFYLCGEYGPTTFRPHYHVCLFGVPDDSLSVLGSNSLGNTLYDSDFIRDTWGKGHIAIGKLNFQTAAYTARYCLKKAQGKDNSFFDSLGVNREFVEMSRKPGIGVQYYQEHKDEIYEHDEIILPASSKDKPNIVRPPRYFDILYSEENPKQMVKIKAQRAEISKVYHENELLSTDLDEVDYFSVKENKKIESLRKLQRNLC